MRRILTVFAVFALLLVAAVTVLLTVPQAIEESIEWTCSQTQPTDNCLVRMRAMGHVWSRKGDLARAEIWYARAAGHGDPASMFHLAWLYEQKGEADIQAAIRRIGDDERTEALMEGRTAAQKLLPQQKYALAADWYRKSAAKGFAPAMNNLGELYLAGLGVAQDARAAFDWHVAAARAGNPVAAMNTALDYRIGRGVGADPAEADKWSSWTANGKTAGLGDLTLERTKMFGASIPAKERSLIRAAAEKGEPVTMTAAPLKPDARVPTFNEVRGQLKN